MKNKGFSLVELMIVVAIITIMASVGMFAIKGRAEKNELIRLRTEIATTLDTGALRAFEIQKKADKVDINPNSIEIKVGARNFETKSKIHTFSLSPSGISIGLNKLGAFENTTNNENIDFDILVKDRDNVEKIRVEVRSNANLGVYSLEVK